MEKICKRLLILFLILALFSAIFIITPIAVSSTDVYISQVYGNGGATDGALPYSFIELYNGSSTEVSLVGKSIQYVALGPYYSVLSFPQGAKIAPKSYYLITIGAAPESDLQWNIASISNQSFKVAMVSGNTRITGSSDVDVLDFIGAWNNTTQIEDYWMVSFKGISKNKSAQRIGFTNNNSFDYAVPRVLIAHSSTYTQPIIDQNAGAVIINQTYGNGGKTETSLSHSFVELYNPTSTAIGLGGLSLQYIIGNLYFVSGTGSIYAFPNNAVIPSHSSYLIRGNLNADGRVTSFTTVNIIMNQSEAISGVINVVADLSIPPLKIDNKQYQVALVKGTNPIERSFDMNVIDFVGAMAIEDGIESPTVDYLTAPVLGGDGEGVSKNKSARRIAFKNTLNNSKDFDTFSYKNDRSLKEIESFRPRGLADGQWVNEEFVTVPTITFDGVNYAATSRIYNSSKERKPLIAVAFYNGNSLISVISDVDNVKLGEKSKLEVITTAPIGTTKVKAFVLESYQSIKAMANSTTY